MIIIGGYIDLDPGQRDVAVAASLELQAATVNDEPGCLAYVFVADPLTAGRIRVYEAWGDAESLNAHFQHPNYHAMRAMLGRFERRGSEIAKHEVARSAPVYGPDRVADANYWL